MRAPSICFSSESQVNISCCRYPLEMNYSAMSKPECLQVIITCHTWYLTLSMLCAVLSDAVPLVVSRQLLQQFTQDIKQKLPHDVHKEVATL